MSSSSVRCVVSRREWMGSARPGVECLEQNCILEKRALTMTRLPSPLPRFLLAPAQSPPGGVERPPGPRCLWPTCLALGLGRDVCLPLPLLGARGSILLELGAPRLCWREVGRLGLLRLGPAGPPQVELHTVGAGSFSQDPMEDRGAPSAEGRQAGGFPGARGVWLGREFTSDLLAVGNFILE